MKTVAKIKDERGYGLRSKERQGGADRNKILRSSLLSVDDAIKFVFSFLLFLFLHSKFIFPATEDSLSFALKLQKFLKSLINFGYHLLSSTITPSTAPSWWWLLQWFWWNEVTNSSQPRIELRNVGQSGESWRGLVFFLGILFKLCLQ